MPETTRQVDRALSIPLTLDRAAADAETQTIPVSIASNAVVEDMLLGPVQLSMDPAAVDLSRAERDGLPVREMHRRDLPVGRVRQLRLDGDKLRGKLYFSSSERGRQLYRDCADGIITDTSVGAEIYAVSQRDDRLIAVSWRPREMSLVDEGADPTVGINRAAQSPIPQPQEALPMATEPTGQPTEHNRSAADPKPTVETGANAAARDEINIRELGDYAHQRAPNLGIDRMRDDFIAFGKPFDEFRGEVWRMLREHQDAQPAVGSPPAEVGMSRQEAQQFSIVRAAHAALSGNWKRAGFELEASRAVAERLGREAQGFFVPLEVQRTMSVGDSSAGGYLVGTEHRADMFIEALRARAIAFGLGVRMLSGLVGNVGIPKQTGNASFYWLSENEDSTQTEPNIGMVALSPRTVAGAVPMTRRLLMQSSPDVENMVRQDLVTGAALAIDAAVFEGDGVKEPKGIFAHADINTVTVSSAGDPTWAQAVKFESEVDTDNALAGSLAMVTTPTVRGNMKVKAKDSGSGLFVCSEANRVNGYPLAVSTQLAASRIGFGDWSQIIVGMWGVLDVKPDEATNAASGGVILRVFQDCDVAIRHAQAFAKNA
jgi:HK97 family phage major capsid protein